MKRKIYFSVLLLCTALTGCSTNREQIVAETIAAGKAGNVEESEETGTEENGAADTGQSDTVEQIDIKETIMEHVTADARMEISRKTYAAYGAEYKTFDREKVAALLWPGSSKEEIQTNEYDGGVTEITFGDESIGFEIGSMRYIKNNDITYLSAIASYGAEAGLLEEKDLAFMPEEQAMQEAESFFAELDLSVDLGEKKILALSKENMSDIQDRMKNEEHYKSFYESGRFQERTFDADDEMYYMKFAFSLDGLPVLGPTDPEVEMVGGVDSASIAFPMEATVLLSDAGICRMDMYGLPGKLTEESEKQEMIGFDEIREGIIKKFGDVILTEDYNLSEIWLEYFPLIKAGSSKKEIDLIPVWCCVFDIDTETDFEVDYALRLNAFTGEEIS